MPIVQMPDGAMVDMPDEISADQAAKLRSLTPSTTGGDTLKFANLDTGIPISENTQNFLAGTGKAFSDIGTGIGQITGLGSSTPQDIVEQKKLDEPLMQTKAGIAGNLAGNVVATLPTMAIPGINTYTGAALLGSGLNALQPAANVIERAKNMAWGGVSGFGGQALGNALGRFVRPLQSNLSPEETRLAQVAANNGIPLSAAQQLNSKPLKTINAVMENLPLTAGSELANQQAQREAFNQAVLARAGITGNVATPDVLAAGKASIGRQLGTIAENNVLDFNQGLVGKLSNIVNDAATHLPPDKASQIASQVDQILTQVDRNGNMLGTNYQGWREPLRALAKKGDEYSRYYGNIRSALDEAFKNQLPDQAGQDFRDLSGQYANLKTVINSMSGNSLNTLAGNISPAQLGIALAQSVGKEGKALGRGELNDLVRAGNLYVRPSVPDSGSAQRLLYQSLLTGGSGLGGAVLSGATGHDPLEGALYGSAAAGGSLLTPKLAQVLLNNAPVQNYLTRQAVSSNAALLASILQNSGRTIGAALPALAQ